MFKLLLHIQASVSATKKENLPIATAAWGLQQHVSLLLVDQVDKGYSPSVP